MKVLRLHNSNNLQLNDEPDPKPWGGEKMINVKAVGICGSDLHWFSEGGIGDAHLEHPLVLGHEFSGITDSGERVAVDPAVPCRQCELCQNGHPNLCEQVVFAGHGTHDGALCERISWNKNNLFVIPDTLSYSDGAMLEPLGVAIHSVDLAHLKTGMTVGIFGCGSIGLLIIQLAKLSGTAAIYATDILAHRLDAALSLGAKQVFTAKEGSEVREIMTATHNRGVDVAFEVSGEQEAVDAAFSSVIPGGKVILVGIPADDRTSFSASTSRRKGLTIKMVRRMKNTYPRAIQLVSSGMVNVSSLVTHRFPIEKATVAFEAAQRREGIKVIIEF